MSLLTLLYTLFQKTIIQASGIASTNQFGVSKIVDSEYINGIASTEQIGSPKTIVTEYPVGIASTNQFGNIVTVKNEISNISGIASTSTFGNDKVNLTEKPNSCININQFGTLNQKSRFTSNITSMGMVSVFGNLTLLIKTPLFINPTGIASTNQFGSTTEHNLNNVNLSGIASNNNFGTVTEHSSNKLSAVGIPSGATFGSDHFGIQSRFVGIPSGVIFGTDTFKSKDTIFYVGIPETTIFGNVNSIKGTVTLHPNSTINSTTFGTTKEIETSHVVSIPANDNFGIPSYTTKETSLPNSIASTNSFGTLEVKETLYVTGIVPISHVSNIVVAVNTTIKINGIESGEEEGWVTEHSGPVSAEVISINPDTGFGLFRLSEVIPISPNRIVSITLENNSRSITVPLSGIRLITVKSSGQRINTTSQQIRILKVA